MGSWSETIMGGDGPLDAQYDVLKLAGFEHGDGDRFHEDHLPELKGLLEKVPTEAWGPFFEEGGSKSYTQDKKRVAAVLIMECGAAMPEFVASQAIKACDEDTSDWRDPDAREFCLRQFAETIKAYDGTPTTIPSEGLFEVIGKSLEVGTKPPRH